MWPSKRTSDSATGYVAGDRSLGTLVMYFITGATIFSAFAFLGMPGWAYSRGVAGLYILAYGALGFLPFYFLGPRAARLGRHYGFVTQAEMIAARYSMPAIAGVMAVISVMAFVPYLALQMKGAGYVLETVTRGGIEQWQGAAIVYGVVLAYVLKSGVLGVGWTNTFQGIFMMALAWFMGLYLPQLLYGGIGPMFERIANERPELLRAPGLTSTGAPWAWSEYSSTVIVSILGFSMWPHLFMKAYTARSERTIRRTVVLYPTFQIFLVPILIIGFAGVLFEPAPPRADQILPHMMMHTELPAIVVGLFCAGALAASMSSGDAMVHAAASIVVRDGIATAFGKELDPHKERAWIRRLVVVVMLGSYALAISYRGSLAGLLIYAYGPVTQFFPAVVATLYARRISGAAVFGGLCAGIVVNTWFVVSPESRPFAIHAGAYGLAANVVTLLVLSRLTRPCSDDAFLCVAGTPPG
ncbi:MAG: sodium:solute symporter family protein [bacterium]|nr:sodium:solute symporter family protein [bacterium]